MTLDDFDAFVSQNPSLHYQTGRLVGEEFIPTQPEDGQGMAFCWPEAGLPYYDQGGLVFVEAAKLSRMTSQELRAELTRGLRVEGITRITGYFTKLSSWNQGKRGELAERYRNKGAFSG